MGYGPVGGGVAQVAPAALGSLPGSNTAGMPTTPPPATLTFGGGSGGSMSSVAGQSGAGQGAALGGGGDLAGVLQQVTAAITQLVAVLGGGQVAGGGAPGKDPGQVAGQTGQSPAQGGCGCSHGGSPEQAGSPEQKGKAKKDKGDKAGKHDHGEHGKSEKGDKGDKGKKDKPKDGGSPGQTPPPPPPPPPTGGGPTPPTTPPPPPPPPIGGPNGAPPPAPTQTDPARLEEARRAVLSSVSVSFSKVDANNSRLIIKAGNRTIHNEVINVTRAENLNRTITTDVPGFEEDIRIRFEGRRGVYTGGDSKGNLLYHYDLESPDVPGTSRHTTVDTGIMNP